MFAMTYQISLPEDYAMTTIRKRVEKTGYKTDGFQGLGYKFYCIKEKSAGSMGNQYAPLYFWKSSEGMNHFLTQGYYDNILASFGWQRVNIGISLMEDFSQEILKARCLMEVSGTIEQRESLKELQEVIERDVENKLKLSRKEIDKSLDEKGVSFLGKAIIYNPEKWQYSYFEFYDQVIKGSGIYEILHVSLGK